MKFRITLAVIISSLLSEVLLADGVWKGQNGSGYVDDEAMWNSTPAPLYSTVTSSGARNYAQIWTSSDWVSTMYLRDLSILNGGFSVNTRPGYDNSIIFDGKDVVFEHGAVPDGMADRPITDVFFCENGSGGSYRYFACNIGNYRGAAYSWSNSYFRIDHRHQTPDSTDYHDGVNTITFGRGTFFWGGVDRESLVGYVRVNSGSLGGCRNDMIITNSTVYCNQLDWYGMTSNSTLLVSGEGAKLETLKEFYFGKTSSADTPGTNVCTISNGATIRVNSSRGASADSAIGSSTTSKQISRLVISGAGSLFDYSNSNRGFVVYDGGEVVITNAGTFNVNTSISLNNTEGNSPGAIRLSGEGSQFLFGDSSRDAEVTLYINGGDDACFEQTGGEIKSNFQCKRLSVYIGSSEGESGVLKISGGKLDMGEGATHGLMRVGMAGSGRLIVSGGSIVGCDRIEVAERDNNGAATTNLIDRQAGMLSFQAD